MRKIISLAVVITLLFGLVSPFVSLGSVVSANVKKNTAVMIATEFRAVGYDWDGEPLDPPRLFPWQKLGSECWGRVDYYMPEASKALDLNNLPKRIDDPENATIPIYYTQVYLNVRAEGELSTESNPYFAVLDSAGQLWFDPDGIFNDCRYLSSADPITPRAPFELYPNKLYSPQSCSTNQKALVDPIPSNNTKGPYYFNRYDPNYSSRQYFWDYKKDEKSDATNRMWRIGWADLVDYPFKGAILPDGSISDGIVRYDSAKNTGDWDYKIPLISFSENEYHTEIVNDGFYTPGRMGENIYSGTTMSNTKMNGDTSQSGRPAEFIYKKVPEVLEEKKGRIIVIVDKQCVWPETQIEIYDSGGNLVASGKPNMNGIYDTGCRLKCPDSYIVRPKNDKCNFSPSEAKVYVQCCPESARVQFKCECQKAGRLIVKVPTDCVVGTTFEIADESGSAKPSIVIPDENGVYDSGCNLKCLTNYIITPKNVKCKFIPPSYRVNVPCCPDSVTVEFKCECEKLGRIIVRVPESCSPTSIKVYDMKDSLVASGTTEKDGTYDTGCTLKCPADYRVVPTSKKCKFDPTEEKIFVPCCPEVAEVKFSPIKSSASNSIKLTNNDNIIGDTNKDKDCGCENSDPLDSEESLMQPIDSIVVEVGDIRLTPVSLRDDKTGVIKNYSPGTIVQDGDFDVGLTLINFFDTEKHAENLNPDGQYDPGEWIYSLTDPTVTSVPIGAIRLTNVNTKRYVSSDRLALDLGCGLYIGDALIMMEVFEGGCHTSTYDVSVLTDLWMGQSPSFTATRLRSPNGDVAVAAQRIQKSTVLDPGLDPERYYLLPGTTFHDIHFEYREYLGVEIFFDNGVDNNINLEDYSDRLGSLDLSDNYRQEKTGELFIGAQNGLSVQDSGRRLNSFTKNYKYYNVSTENPPRYGCGEAIYYLDDADRYVIQAGDKRVTDVELLVGGVHISYKRNTIVADGDADAGLFVVDFDKEKIYIPRLDNVTPEYDAPFDYDPALNDIYYDNDGNYLVSSGDIRLNEIDVEGAIYPCGSLVTGGDFWFLDAPIRMISVGKNGDYNFIDSEVVPGDIGLNVSLDKPLKVEQTSTITVSVEPPPKENEVVYVSIQSPQANEFNLFRENWMRYDRKVVDHEYYTGGTPMHWYTMQKKASESWLYELPFEFPFMGKFYGKVYIASEGFLNFSSSYSDSIGLSDFDARIMVYGDDLMIKPSDDPSCIIPNLPTDLSNSDPEDIYILESTDSVTIRWRAQTQYETTPTGFPEDAGIYQAPNGKYYGLIDAQVTLFYDGSIKFSYLRDVIETYGDDYWKLTNRVNNVPVDSWVEEEPIVGLTNGEGYYLESAFNNLKNIACVDGAYYEISNKLFPYSDPFGGEYTRRDPFNKYGDELWVPERLPFNEPSPDEGDYGSSYPEYNEEKPYEDFRVLTSDQPVATFSFTPYRGTCKESGFPEWVEVRAYKDLGGRKIAPPDSKYSFYFQENYADPTIWNSKWTKEEYWKYPWGLFQKTKYFVYPPISPPMPREIKDVYDCFGLDRLQIEHEELILVPSKECVSPMDERQPLTWCSVYDADNFNDVNDPQGMAVSTFRRAADARCSTGAIVQIDYGITNEYWNIDLNMEESPVGARYLTIDPAYIDAFKVGDIVYISPYPYVVNNVSYPPPAAEWRKIVRIDRARNRIWFDLPLTASYPPGTQVVPNPIVGNYNIKGGGIKGVFTAIGAVGQRYIVQVRDDGSYDYWRWFEPLVIGQVVGVLDPNDVLYTWQQPGAFDRSEATSPYTPIRTPFPFPNPRPAGGLQDLDCSVGSSLCSICGDTTEFPKLGEWSKGDMYGVFGNGSDIHPYFPNINGIPPQPFGSIYTWGVPVLIMPNKSAIPTENLFDEGGKFIIAAWPQDPSTPMNIRLYLNNALFDYNSKISHPPYFIPDLGNGIDYCGEVSIKVSNVDPVVNFPELTIIDHALQNSKVNYTFGNEALVPLPPPNPQIASRYYPLLTDLNKELRSYPGGQTNTGRVTSDLGLTSSKTSNGASWNAYNAIWNDKFVKLGTEFMPLTDYGLAFYLKGGANPYDKLSFFGGGMQRIYKIEIEGPFAVPKTFTEDLTRGRPGQPDLYTFRLNTGYDYNQYHNVPINYDFSGKIEANYGNYPKYELTPGNLGWYSDPFLCAYPLPSGTLDFRMVTQPIAPFDAVTYPLNEVNPWLKLDNKWFYWGAFRFPNTYPYWYYQTVFLFDELIPVGNGPLKIKVTLYNGTVYSYNSLCDGTEGIPIHGINIEDAPKTLEIDEDHSFDVTLTEGYVPSQDTEYCNNAFLVIWQDRGILDAVTNTIIGAGDGHIANPPRSSNWHIAGTQYMKDADLDGDGKISFAKFETEIMGSYDLATNTWSNGVIDGRTYMKEYGIYNIKLTSDNGSQLTTIGYDFGGIPDEVGEFDKKPDHVISEYEILPIYINAYKYADDNNDRGFTPLWHPVPPYEYSHEVYLSGMTKITPVPRNDLLVSYTPDPLTAGITPELVNPDKPLTFLVLNEDGNPIDLSHGVMDKNGRDYVPTRSIWNILFQDPHPDNKEFFGNDAKLPQYYWVRTDLQNNDGNLYDNESIYFSSLTPFDPISVDFSSSKDGKYTFFNFCANDAGSFVVRVYTPDRRHYGETTVSVKLPSVSYKIVNDEDPEERVFEVPGSPDFVLTAIDKRVYTIEAQIYDAQGEKLRGSSGVACEGYIGARFTPMTTFLRNFRYAAIAQRRYYNLLGVDKNKNGDIDPLNLEKVNIDGFEVIVGNTRYTEALYCTQNAIMYDGRFYTGVVLDIPPEYTTFGGWGLGCIYNSAYKGGYCFADLDKDKDLTFADSLPLDSEGKVRFKVYVNDYGLNESYLGGLVGVNRLSTSTDWSDIAGIPGFSGDAYAPYDIARRFRYGGARQSQGTMDTFRLDWDSHSDVFVSIKGPDFRLLNAKTRQPIGMELLDPSRYDLCYGTLNHIVIQALPADSRDLPIKEDGSVYLEGAEHERFIVGKLKKGQDGLPETVFSYTPTGIGRSAVALTYVRLGGGWGEFEDNLDVGLNEYTYFDVAHGLDVKAIPLGDLYPRKKAVLRLKVSETGSEAPVEKAEVWITGAGINVNGSTNSEGICEVEILPTEEGEINITARKSDYLPGTTNIYIGRDIRPLFLYVDPTPSLTKENSIIFAGYTKATATLTINDQIVNLDAKGNFSVKFDLTEGENKFKFVAKSDEEIKEEERIIVRDSTPPNIEIFDVGTLVDVKDILVRGKVSEENSTIIVNGKKAEIVGINWQVNVSVEYGKNTIYVTAKDLAGNENYITKELYVYQKIVVEIQLNN